MRTTVPPFPRERAFGDLHGCCTRNRRSTRLPALVADVQEPLQVDGPWSSKLSAIY
jgi:hypothetical protein